MESKEKFRGHIKFIGYAISELSYIDKLEVLSKSILQVMLEDAGVDYSKSSFTIKLGKYRTELDIKIDREDSNLQKYLKDGE